MLVTDISAGGIGVITRGYLYDGTCCSFTLIKNSGDEFSAIGRVVWCRFLSGQCHSAGVVFEQKIDPKEVISPKAWLDSPSRNTAVRSETLHGKALHVENDPMVIKLAEMMLANTEVSITAAHDSGTALDRIKRESFDAIIVGIGDTYHDLKLFIETISREGYRTRSFSTLV